MKPRMVTVELTWDEARALSFAASIGLSAENATRWPSPVYQQMGGVARERLLAAAAEPSA